MESFVFEQKALYMAGFLSVTSDYRVQCPRGQNLGHLRFFFSKPVFMSFSDTQCLFLDVCSSSCVDLILH